MQTILFPDSELMLVRELKALLLSAGVPAHSFRVATQKLGAGKNVPKYQVIVRSEGGSVFSTVLKEETLTILVWTAGPDANARFADANSFTLLLEALLPLLQGKVVSVVSVEQVQSSPIVYEGEEELRDISFALTTRGEHLTLS